MVMNRSKQSASQTWVCVCLPVSLQNITFFPHPYFLCGSRNWHIATSCHKNGEGGKNLSPHRRINSGRFCFLFALSIRSEDESSNKMNGLANSGQIRCPYARFTAALVSKEMQGRDNFSEHLFKRTGKQWKPFGLMDILLEWPILKIFKISMFKKLSLKSLCHCLVMQQSFPL